jgi:hypothetical protein
MLQIRGHHLSSAGTIDKDSVFQLEFEIEHSFLFRSLLKIDAIFDLTQSQLT